MMISIADFSSGICNRIKDTRYPKNSAINVVWNAQIIMIKSKFMNATVFRAAKRMRSG